MTVEELLIELTPIFHSELENPALVLKPEMTAADVETWDSITHVQLIVAIEKKYKIRFTSREIQDLKNVGELCSMVLSKIEN